MLKILKKQQDTSQFIYFEDTFRSSRGCLTNKKTPQTSQTILKASVSKRRQKLSFSDWLRVQEQKPRQQPNQLLLSNCDTSRSREKKIDPPVFIGSTQIKNKLLNDLCTSIRFKHCVSGPVASGKSFLVNEYLKRTQFSCVLRHNDICQMYNLKQSIPNNTQTLVLIDDIEPIHNTISIYLQQFFFPPKIYKKKKKKQKDIQQKTIYTSLLVTCESVYQLDRHLSWVRKLYLNKLFRPYVSDLWKFAKTLTPKPLYFQIQLSVKQCLGDFRQLQTLLQCSGTTIKDQCRNCFESAKLAMDKNHRWSSTTENLSNTTKTMLYHNAYDDMITLDNAFKAIENISTAHIFSGKFNDLIYNNAYTGTASITQPKTVSFPTEFFHAKSKMNYRAVLHKKISLFCSYLLSRKTNTCFTYRLLQIDEIATTYSYVLPKCSARLIQECIHDCELNSKLVNDMQEWVYEYARCTNSSLKKFFF